MSRNLSWFDHDQLRKLFVAIGVPAGRRESDYPSGGAAMPPSTLDGQFMENSRFAAVDPRPGRFAEAASTQPGPPEQGLGKKATQLEAGAAQRAVEAKRVLDVDSESAVGPQSVPEASHSNRFEPTPSSVPPALVEWGGAAAARHREASLRSQWEVAERATTGLDERRHPAVPEPADINVTPPTPRGPPVTEPPKPRTKPPILPFQDSALPHPRSGLAAGETPPSSRAGMMPPSLEDLMPDEPELSMRRSPPARGRSDVPSEVDPSSRTETDPPPSFNVPRGAVHERLEAFVTWVWRYNQPTLGAVAVFDHDGLPVTSVADFDEVPPLGLAMTSILQSAMNHFEALGMPLKSGRVVSTHELRRFSATWARHDGRTWWLVLRGTLEADPVRLQTIGDSFRNVLGMMTETTDTARP